MKVCHLGLIVILLGCSPAAAQNPPDLTFLREIPAGLLQASGNIDKELNKLAAAMVDLPVPDSPAFTVLGLTPEEVARPTSARKLAASLLNGVDRKGVLQSGVALDTLPYLALAGHLIELTEYRVRARYLLRFAARTQLSVATSKASDVNDKAMRVALGMRMTLVDFGDPRTDAGLEKCFDGRPGLPIAPTRVLPPAPDPPITPEELAEWMKDVEQVPDPQDPKKVTIRNSRLLGIQIRAGTVDSSLAFETLIDETTPAGGTASTDRRMSLGYERRLAPNLWLGVAVGSGAPAAGDKKKSGFVLSSLKWGFAEGPSLGMGQ
jgi:hypothetical protein